MGGGLPDLSSEELKELGYSVPEDEDQDDEDDEDDEGSRDEDDDDEDDEDMEDYDERMGRMLGDGSEEGGQSPPYPTDLGGGSWGHVRGGSGPGTPRHGLQYGLGARGRAGGHAVGRGTPGVDSDMDNGPLHLPRRLSQGLPGNLVAGLSDPGKGSPLPVGMPERAQRERAVKWVNSIGRATSAEEAKSLIPPLEGDPEDGEELLELVLNTVAAMRGALEQAAMQMYGSSPARPRASKRARETDVEVGSPSEETEEEESEGGSGGAGPAVKGTDGGGGEGGDTQGSLHAIKASLQGQAGGSFGNLGFALLSPRVGGQSRIPGDEEAASSSGVKLGRDYQATLVHDAETFPEMLLPDADAERAWNDSEKLLWRRPPRFAESAVSEYVRHAVRLARCQSCGPRLGMSRGAIEERALTVLLEHDWDATAALAALAALPSVPAHLSSQPGVAEGSAASRSGVGAEKEVGSKAPSLTTGPVHTYHAAWSVPEELAFEAAISQVGRDFRDVADRIGGGKTPADCASYYYNVYKRQQYRVGTKATAWAARSMRSNDWLSPDRKRSRAATARSHSEYGFERGEAIAPLLRPRASDQAVGQALGGRQAAIARTALAVAAAAAAGEATARAAANSVGDEAESASTAAAMASERARQTGEEVLTNVRPLVTATVTK